MIVRLLRFARNDRNKGLAMTGRVAMKKRGLRITEGKLCDN
jgi:hypothetical protein